VRELLRNRASDALGSAGHNCDLVLEFHHDAA
jgi:hypothetical protein